MKHIEVHVSGTRAYAKVFEPLTSGMVGLPVRLFFDSSWDGLVKSVTFKAGKIERSRVGIGIETSVPWEVMTAKNCVLQVGVKGSDHSNNTVIPTIWADVDVIQPGATVSTEEEKPATPTVSEQALQVAIEARERVNSISVKKTNDDGVVISDLENNHAIGKNSIAAGADLVSGLLGYYIKAVNFTTNTVYLSAELVAPTITAEDLTDAAFESPAYIAGDTISIIKEGNSHWLLCGEIVSIEHNKVVCSELPFAEIDNSYYYSFSVRDKPLVGALPLTYAVFVAGGNNIMAGRFGFGGGYGNRGYGDYSFVAGKDNRVGYCAGSLGKSNIVMGHMAFAIGWENEASTEVAFAGGYRTKARARAAVALGIGTTAEAEAALALGQNTFVSGKWSIASGDSVKVLASAAFYFGQCWSNAYDATTGEWKYGAHGVASFVANRQNKTTAKAIAATVFGWDNIANNESTFVIGVGNRADGKSQFVGGRYNIPDTTSIIIFGNGTNDSNRSNAFKLAQNGNAWFAGTVTAGADPINSMDLVPLGYMQKVISKPAYTTLRKEIASNYILVDCHNLIPGEGYKILLYMVNRRRGNEKSKWLHPANGDKSENTWKGYRRLGERSEFPRVPNWMPNEGILRTEWYFTANAENQSYSIDLGRMMVDMLKPDVPGERFTLEEPCNIIGLTKGARASLLMQFRIMRVSTGEIGETQNTLRIGVKRQTKAVSGQRIYLETDEDERGYIPSRYLYRSIM